MTKLQGCYTALITPFRDGVIDWNAFEKIIEAQITGGVDGLVPVGTTGESPSLSYKEHMDVIEFTVKCAAGRTQIIAGSGANSTSEAVELTCKARDLGVDATLQVTPYYNKPTQAGIFQHFSTVADAAGLPVVLYNVPGRSGVEIAIDTVAKLAENKNVIAIKEAAGSAERVSQILDRCDLTVLSGDDALTLPMISVGAKGVISVASNYYPAEVSRLAHLALDNDLAAAQALHKTLYPFFRDEFIESNPIPVKAAMAMAGRIKEEYRLPLCEISDASRQQLIKSIARVDKSL